MALASKRPLSARLKSGVGLSFFLFFVRAAHNVTLAFHALWGPWVCVACRRRPAGEDRHPALAASAAAGAVLDALVKV